MKEKPDEELSNETYLNGGGLREEGGCLLLCGIRLPQKGGVPDDKHLSAG